MGLLNSALHIGRNALLGYQGALQIVGNNISSAGSPDYTRLSPDLTPLQASLQANDLTPGAGVSLSGIQRNLDEALEAQLRLAIGRESSAATQQQAIARVESLFDSVNGTDLATRLQTFLNNFDEVHNNPEDVPIRELAISSGVQLAEALHLTRSQLISLGADMDGQIADLVTNADDIAHRIARLNEQISTTEANGGGIATGLRDQRDALLRDLSDIFDVTVREQPDGSFNVYVGSEALIQGSAVRELTAVSAVRDGFVETSVRFADSNQQIDVGGGRLAGLIRARDELASGQFEALDEFAQAVIFEINRLHADGQGLRGYRQLTGAQDVLATDQPLNGDLAGLPTAPTHGSFFVSVMDDATHTPVAYRIDVPFDDTGDTTLESLVEQFNTTVTGVTASITSDNRLSLTADEGLSFVFGYDGQSARRDTSGVLAALGMNTFFTGTGAADIAVNGELTAEPALLAAATEFLPGDGGNAAGIAALETTASDRLGDVSILDFYNGIATAVAVQSAAVKDTLDAASAVHASLQTQKESISGVNLDEEAISLLKYQRAFQGASRFVSVVDGMLSELIALVR